MEVYRLTKPAYATDLSGMGAAREGGRWNPRGLPVLYTAASPALAALEVLAQISDPTLAGEFRLVTLEVPDDAKTAEFSISDLPPGWSGSPAPPELAAMGRRWLTEGATLLFRVPSAVVCGFESNLLINPAHGTFGSVRIARVAPFTFDPRLL